MRAETVRIAVLATLVVQNSAQALFMRYAFKPKEQADGEEEPPHPASSTAVLLAEVTKFVCSWILLYRVSNCIKQQTNNTYTIVELTTIIIKQCVCLTTGWFTNKTLPICNIFDAMPPNVDPRSGLVTPLHGNLISCSFYCMGLSSLKAPKYDCPSLVFFDHYKSASAFSLGVRVQVAF